MSAARAGAIAKRGRIKRKTRAGFRYYDHGEPIKAIDTRPMAFVFGLVALVMIAAEPVPTHALLVDLRETHSQPLSEGYFDDIPESNQELITNEVIITSDNRVLWNCEQVTQSHLVILLRRMEQVEPKPVLIFRPDPNANYDFAVRFIQLFKAANVSKLRLAGLENHASFGRANVSISGTASLSTALSIIVEPISPYDEAQIAKALAAQCPSKRASK